MNELSTEAFLKAYNASFEQGMMWEGALEALAEFMEMLADEVEMESYRLALASLEDYREKLMTDE